MRGMLFDERKSLSRLDQEIDRLEAILADLHKKRKDCIARMVRYSVALSPQKHIPLEILAKIFVHSLCYQPTALPPTATASPWVLRWICSRWRQVAMAEHRLWSNLDLGYTQLDTTESVLTTWILNLRGRTESFPVLLAITSYDTGVAFRDPLFPYFHRLQSLSLNISKKSLPESLITPPFAFECLESLTLDFTQGIPFKWTGIFVQDPPRAVFTMSPSLRKITLQASCMEFIALAIIFRLPWSQLTHINFSMIQVSFRSLVCILRRCQKLISFTFTPDDTEALIPSVVASLPELLLPNLRSLTWITSDDCSASPIFALLRVPSLNECTVKGVCEDEDEYYLSKGEQSSLISMLSRSGCSLQTLNLSDDSGGICLKNLLSVLPDLVNLVVCDLNPMPDTIFDMMIQREGLQKLQNLECFVESPIPFLQLLEHQSNIQTFDAHGGLISAEVSYRPPDTTEERFQFDVIGRD